MTGSTALKQSDPCLSTVKLSEFIRSMKWSKNGKTNEEISKYSTMVHQGVTLILKHKSENLIDEKKSKRFTQRLNMIIVEVQTGAKATTPISRTEAYEIADYFKSIPIE